MVPLLTSLPAASTATAPAVANTCPRLRITASGCVVTKVILPAYMPPNTPVSIAYVGEAPEGDGTPATVAVPPLAETSFCPAMMRTSRPHTGALMCAAPARMCV